MRAADELHAAMVFGSVDGTARDDEVIAGYHQHHSFWKLLEIAALESCASMREVDRDALQPLLVEHEQSWLVCHTSAELPSLGLGRGNL